MKSLKRTLLLLLSVGTIISGGITPLYATEIQKNDTVASIIAPAAMMEREKTVVKFYANFDAVPQSIYYTEYLYGINWRGTLSLKKAEQSGSGWYATYEGLIVGHS
mgnify:CR=1 FL=1